MIEQIKEKILAIIENHRKFQNNVKSFNPNLAMGLQALIDEDNYILSTINSMPKYSESDVWHDEKDRPPFAGKEILVRRGDKNYYGKYIGGARRFVCAEIRLTDDTAETYAIINYMSDDDKWAYLDDLITFAPSVTKKSDQEEILILKDQIESCHAAMKCKDELLEIRQKQLMDKMCEWLKKNFNMPNDFENHFRKAMEEKYECGV